MCGGGRHPLRCCTAIYIYNIISTQVQRWSPELSCRLRTVQYTEYLLQAWQAWQAQQAQQADVEDLDQGCEIVSYFYITIHQWYSMRQSIQDIINKGREKIKMKKQMNDTQYVQHS